MDKPSMATLETFNGVFPRDDPRAVRRPMFGMDSGVVDDKLFSWVREALDHTASLPKKEKKPKRAGGKQAKEAT